MTLTITDLFDRLKELDEISILEILSLTSEELVDRFQDEIENKYDELSVKFEDEDSAFVGR